MATHDYVIDNSTGANVRADINSVLQAILSNNSSSSAPSTTAAYMFWADTTSGTLKIRNSADNAWIELLQLDGTLTLEDGSGSSPALAFRDDLNTGIFSSGADTFDIATGGIGRLQIDITEITFNDSGDDTDFRIEGDTDTHLLFLKADNNHIGIGTSNPLNKLHIQGGGIHITDATVPSIRLVAADNSNGSNTNRAFFGIATGSNNFMNGTAANDTCIVYSEGGDLKIGTGSNVQAILDSDGRLLLGTTVEGNSSADDLTVATSGHTGITIRSGTGSYGQIFFSRATSGTGEYEGFLAYEHGTDSLQFATDHTERFRIDSVGRVMVGVTSASDAATALTVKNMATASEHTIIEMICDNNQTARIEFSETSTSRNGSIRYSFTSDARLMSFHTDGNSNRMQIDNAGRVSIGTTDVTAHFNVHVNAASRVPQIINDTNNTSTFTHRLRFDTGGNEVGRIRSSNTETVYDTSASDITLKKNFEDWTENTLDLFKNINPQKFHFIQEEDTAEKSKGFIAQEMVDSFPEAYTKETKKDSKYYFNPSGMVVYLMKAIQELEAKVAALEAAQ